MGKGERKSGKKVRKEERKKKKGTFILLHFLFFFSLLFCFFCSSTWAPDDVIVKHVVAPRAQVADEGAAHVIIWISVNRRTRSLQPL